MFHVVAKLPTFLSGLKVGPTLVGVRFHLATIKWLIQFHKKNPTATATFPNSQVVEFYEHNL
jgi:hypothetical protein